MLMPHAVDNRKISGARRGNLHYVLHYKTEIVNTLGGRDTFNRVGVV